MTAMTGRVIVAAAPDAVFRYVSDLANGPKWIPYLIRAERTSEATDGLDLEVEIVAGLSGREWHGTGRCVGWDPPSLFTLEAAFEEEASSVVAAEIEPHDSGSLVYVTVEYELPSTGVRRVAMGMLGERAVRRELEKALTALKHHLETPTASAR
jgi:hypothetical protein